MPRHFGDFERNDDIYEEFDRVDLLPTSSGHLAASMRMYLSLSFIEPDSERKPRSKEEMTEEAIEYSEYLKQFQSCLIEYLKYCLFEYFCIVNMHTFTSLS